MKGEYCSCGNRKEKGMEMCEDCRAIEKRNIENGIRNHGKKRNQAKQLRVDLRGKAVTPGYNWKKDFRV